MVLLCALEAFGLAFVLIGRCARLCCFVLLLALVLLRLAFFAKVITAGQTAQRLFDLALGLISGTHVRSVSLVSLPTEYPHDEGFKQAALLLSSRR